MEERKYDEIVEFEILEFLNNNENKEYTTTEIIALFPHHNFSMMNRILNNMSAYIGSLPNKSITALGKKVLEYEIEKRNAKKKEYKEKISFLLYGAGISFIVSILSGLATTYLILTLTHQKPQDINIVSPKVQMVKIQDTVFVKHK